MLPPAALAAARSSATSTSGSASATPSATHTPTPTSAAATPTSDPAALPFLQVIEAVNARPLSLGERDLLVEFDEAEADVPLWDQDAAGTIIDDPDAPAPHERFLQIESMGMGLPISRIVRDDVGVNLFRAGQDLETFTDSSDLYAAVDVRLGEDAAAWMGVRATPFIVGSEVESYLIELPAQCQTARPAQSRATTASLIAS